jgi:NADH-quinone oxidoreductase subunit G
VDALLAVTRALGIAGRQESGLIEVPGATNARGMRETGVAPGLAPGLTDAAEAGMTAAQMAAALGEGELSALILLHADPLATHPERPRWEAALDGVSTVIAFTEFVGGALAENATVIFPAESYAEKEGTLTHPDGRLQRVRQAIGHQGRVRPEWSVLAELAERCGAGLDVLSAPQVSEKLFVAVGFYNGLTLEEIGGKGVRWQDRDAASRLPAAELPEGSLEVAPELSEGMRLGTTASLWSGPTVEHAPSLRFLAPAQRAELAPSDARRLGVTSGDEVEVAAGGESLRATVALRQAMQPGSVFLVAGTAENNPTVLTNGVPRAVEITKAGSTENGAGPSAGASTATGPGAQTPPT